MITYVYFNPTFYWAYNYLVSENESENSFWAHMKHIDISNSGLWHILIL